jgi:hypothetical protein
LVKSTIKDTDQDGIPDSWEKSKRLNLKYAADAQQINANGYSNLEQYLNDLVK